MQKFMWMDTNIFYVAFHQISSIAKDLYNIQPTRI